MDRARKRLVSAIDGLRAQFTDADSEDAGEGTATPPAHPPTVRERVEPAHCRLSNIVRHGFPDQPNCMAYDPVQRLCAIGAGRGCVRLLGQTGVDQLLKHDSEEPVTHVQFLINEGGLVTALEDDTLHLWNYRQRIPEIVHSLRMSKERISAVYLPFQSRWLHVGTDKGNVYFVCLASFELSSYVIQWNKAIDLSCRTHPGSVRSLEACPIDQTKLLIVFDKGHIVLWNILTREAERFAAAELSPVTAICWNCDGKQFMCGHTNGSLSFWSTKKPREVVHHSTPHSPLADEEASGDNGALGEQRQRQEVAACKPITQLSWNVNGEGEQLIVFAGGMPMDEGALPSLTVMRAKGSLTVLEMDHPIVSMVPLQASPYASTAQHPHSMAVLLKNDFLVVDMQTQGYPCFEVPHPMDLHESPVTLLRYFSDCPVELIAALTLIGRNQRRQGVYRSERQWPMNGGVGRECATGHQEMVLTGHEDGSIKFWQASSEQLQIMYKLKTGRHFEKSLSHNATTAVANAGEEKAQIAPLSHAVADLQLCVDSRLLLVASRAGQVTLFRFAKSECCQEIAVVMLPQLCCTTASIISPSAPPSPKETTAGDHSPRPPQLAQNHHQTHRLKQQQRSSASSSSTAGQRAELRRQGAATAGPDMSTTTTLRNSRTSSSHSTDTSVCSHYVDLAPLKVRGGALRRPAGYQPELVCQIPWINGARPEQITALALNSGHWLIAIGTCVGLALVDAQTAAQIYAWSNSELLGREPIPFWSSSLPSQASEAVTSPSGEHQQFSAQSAPGSQQPKSPPPAPILSRNNTTDSSSTTEATAATTTSITTPEKPASRSLSARLARPQLLKAFTFNPSAQSGNGGGAGDGSPKDISTPPAPQSAGLSEKNFNGNLDSDSRASSSESLDNDTKATKNGTTSSIPEDFVCSLEFINCAAKLKVPKLDLCLWLGTSTGAAVAFQLQIPTNRITSSVIVAPSGSIIRMSGRLLCSAFLDRTFRVLSGPTEQFKNAESAGPSEALRPNKVLTKASLSPVLGSDGENPLSAGEDEFQQLALLVSDSEVRAIQLPSYQQIFHRKVLEEDGPWLRAKVSHVSGHPVLVVLGGAGNLMVLSLPSLRPLAHTPLIGHPIDIEHFIYNRYNLSEHGLGMYMVSPSEIQKFTVSAEIANQVADCIGELFVPCDMPEPPKQQSFLRGILASAVTGIRSAGNSADQMAELDTLLREKPTSGVVRTVARPLITPQQQQLTNLELSSNRSITAGQAAQQAMENISERGERLSAVTDATEQLRNNAQAIQARSAKLLEKYEKRKWYHL